MLSFLNALEASDPHHLGIVTFDSPVNETSILIGWMRLPVCVCVCAFMCVSTVNEMEDRNCSSATKWVKMWTALESVCWILEEPIQNNLSQIRIVPEWALLWFKPNVWQTETLLFCHYLYWETLRWTSKSALCCLCRASSIWELDFPQAACLWRFSVIEIVSSQHCVLQDNWNFKGWSRRYLFAYPNSFFSSSLLSFTLFVAFFFYVFTFNSCCLSFQNLILPPLNLSCDIILWYALIEREEVKMPLNVQDFNFTSSYPANVEQGWPVKAPTIIVF